MGEGVSLSLPRNGFLIDNHLVVSVPFLRDPGLNGEFIFQDLQAVKGDSFCGNKLSGCLSCPSLNEVATLTHRKADGRRESISTARHVLPISIRQDLGWFGAAVFAHTSCGEMPKSWFPDLGKLDCLGSESCAPKNNILVESFIRKKL